MRIIKHPILSNGQPLLTAKGSAAHDACQHLAMAQPQRGAYPMKPFESNSSNNAPLVITSGDTVQGESISAISKLDPDKELFRNGALKCLRMPDMDFTPVADQSFLCSLSENKKFIRIDDAVGNIDHDVTSKPKFMLSVSVSSAVKLDGKHIELIARKMQKLTGFNNLRLENTIDPSLIAGFTICYGDGESHIIDLSVKGQLASLAARVESLEQSRSSLTA